MDNVLDNAKAHFKRQLENPMRSIEVPEWGNGTPAKIYFHEVMTMREKTAIGNLSANGKSDEAVAMTLILRARDENGTLMFNKSSHQLNKLLKKILTIVLSFLFTWNSVTRFIISTTR